MTILTQNKIQLYIIPFILGIISSFSLPPYNFFFINFITFPLLLIFLIFNYKKGKWQSFQIGWMFGIGYFVSNLYWITNSLTFDSNFQYLIPIALILIPLFLGIFYGLVTFICSFFSLNKRFSSILLFSIIFSLIEFLRSFILGGFPWNLIAFSFSKYLPFLQILSYFGTYSFNLLSLSAFLIPTIIFFNYKKIKKIIILVSTLLILIINFLFGTIVLKNNEKIKETNLDFVIKIVSPKIEIKRFFENENQEKIICEIVKLSEPNNRKIYFIFQVYKYLFGRFKKL